MRRFPFYRELGKSLRRPTVVLSAWFALGAIQVNAATLNPVSTLLHAESTALNRADSQSDHPPDTMGGPTYGLTQATASVYLHGSGTNPYTDIVDSWGSASISANVQPEQIKVDVNSSFLWQAGGSGSGTASGTITFDLPTATTMVAGLTASGWLSTGVVINSGGTEFYRKEWQIGSPFSPPPYTSSFTLPAGRYDIQISEHSQTYVGTGGPGSMSFSLTAAPEPATLGVLGIAAITLLTRRRHVH